MVRLRSWWMFVLFGFGTSVSAGGPGIDRDGDGLYSFEELLEEYPTLAVDDFAELDRNEDGWVSPEEFRKGLDQDMLPRVAEK